MNSRLSIIIVAYYNAHLLEQCLASVFRYLPNDFFELIVVSNGFGEMEKTNLIETFREIQWLDMPYNAGFSRANNAGMHIAKGDIFLLLNPDTIAIDNSIERCAEQLRQSSFVAAGVQLLDESGKMQISGSHFVKGGLNHLLPIPYWGDFIRWVGYKAKAKVPGVQEAQKVEEVDWISGAFLMVKRSATEKAGLMDEDFFLYGEEVEWCSRLKKTGRLVLFGDLKIVHLEGATINKSQNIEEKGYYNLYDKKGLQLMVSNHLRVRKQYGPFWYFVLLLNYSFGGVVFGIAGSLNQLVRLKNPFPVWNRVGAFGKNVLTLWRLTPTIIRKKPFFYKMF
ncbi:glycosyltransferase family 2 protein [Flavisolibacter sp. BT320]|nr:glycosyltransferase family 2 protein [Flavisolibacter longurius]